MEYLRERRLGHARPLCGRRGDAPPKPKLADPDSGGVAPRIRAFRAGHRRQSLDRRLRDWVGAARLHVESSSLLFDWVFSFSNDVTERSHIRGEWSPHDSRNRIASSTLASRVTPPLFPGGARCSVHRTNWGAK